MSQLAWTIAAALAATPVAAADTIRATSGFGPNHIMATAVYPELFQRLKAYTDGRWSGQDTAGGLLAPNEMNTGLRDGVTDMGALIMPYFAAEYVDSLLPGDLSMVGTDNLAISSAVTEYLVTCADCQAEFAANGQVYLGSDATTTYNLLSTKPLNSLEDLRGVRIRTAGAIFSQFIHALGAEPVQIPSSELFEGLSAGLVDATYSSIPDLKNAGLFEAIHNVTLLQLGVFNTGATTNASQILWGRMSDEDRAALAHAAQMAQAAGAVAWRETEKAARAEGEVKGIVFAKPDDSLMARAHAFQDEHLSQVATDLTKRGVKEAETKVQTYLALVEKWEKLVTPDMSAEQLGDLRFREIWSKIDFASYGM